MELVDLKTREIEIIEELEINANNKANLIEALNKTEINKNVTTGKLIEVQSWIRDIEAADVPETTEE
jgi:hypothetical protein